MSVVAFQPSRADGRSDRQVVFELVKDNDPDTIVTYDEIREALAEGLPDEPDMRRVYPAVSAANKLLLRECKRYLMNVRDTGYRIIRADEHMSVAVVKKDRAQTYLKQGMDILRQTRIDELPNEQRSLHQGYVMMFAGLYHAVQASDQRQQKQQDAIDSIIQRLDKIEQTV